MGWEVLTAGTRRVVWLSAVWVISAGILPGCGGEPRRHELPQAALDEALLHRLEGSEWRNAAEVVAALGLSRGDTDRQLAVRDPYRPATPLSAEACAVDPVCRYRRDVLGFEEAVFPGIAVVHAWWQQHASDGRVCGLRFLDSAREGYRLDTFPDRDALAESGGYHLTHHGACGTCSSLQDLAVYARLDLTRMAADCARRLTLAGRTSCMQAIGFSDTCAQTWAYNAGHSRRYCTRLCLADGGWRTLISGAGPATNLPDGRLSACLQCDERISGPGFQYSAGRTRRNSGITAEIQRPDTARQSVPHDYFRSSTGP